MQLSTIIEDIHSSYPELVMESAVSVICDGSAESHKHYL